MDSATGTFTTMFRLLSIVLAAAVTLTAADIRPLSGDGRIIGGVPATIEQHPYQVSIEINGKHKGSGAILTEKYVITAAHVLPLLNLNIKYINVVAGVTDRSSRQRQDYKSTNWIPFPNYQSHDNDKDVAIIIVDTPIKFGPGVQPISLLTKQEHPKPGDMLTLSGWGSIRARGGLVLSLRAVRIPTLSQETCRNATKGGPFAYTDNMMCAGGSQEPKVAGPGDSGGPAVTDSKKLAGIISWGKLVDLAGSSTVLADVTSPPVADFIKAVLNGTITEDVPLQKRRKELEEKKREQERKKREEEKRREEERKKARTSKPSSV